MNGNNPYAGSPGVTPAGQRATEDMPELTPEQRRHLRSHVSEIVAMTRELLPDEYAIGGELHQGVRRGRGRLR